MPTKDELKALQSLPLKVKVAKTKQRIREWVDRFGTDGVYVSFSGGKDSTVLLHIVREMYGNDIPAVFVNTGLEYPEIQSFVKTFENVEILRPKMRFDEVIKKYGYPIIGKETSQAIYEARKKPDGAQALKFVSGSEHSEKYGPQYDLSKWKPLLESKIPISHLCCKVMKKSPAYEYEKLSSRRPIIGTMAEESALRETKWLREGCNAFDAKCPSSQPVSFWIEQDVLQYIKEDGLPIASVYGDIVAVDENKNQYDNPLFDDGLKLKTTGCHRTGCIFCAFGAHCRGDTRFVDLKQTHPKQYDYCIGGGEFNGGIWQPSKDGLGMGYVFDSLNEIYGDGLSNTNRRI